MSLIRTVAATSVAALPLAVILVMTVHDPLVITFGPGMGKVVWMTSCLLIGLILGSNVNHIEDDLRRALGRSLGK